MFAAVRFAGLRFAGLLLVTVFVDLGGGAGFQQAGAEVIDLVGGRCGGARLGSV
jgi:hypothetical protein